jgi:hypothetical protein
MMTISSGLTLHWKVDSTYWYGMLVYTDSAWVAIGPSNKGYMVGSDVIMGLPSDSTVYLYDLTAKTTGGIEKMSSQTALSSGAISQASSTTTMTFTVLLDQSSFDVSRSGPQSFIWAYGTSNSLAYHKDRGAFSLDLTTCSTSTVTTDELSTSVVLAHGALMLLAWAWLFPGGVACALLKFKLGDAWMDAHMALQIGGTVVAIAAVCAMALGVDTTTGAEHMNGDHPSWGVAALCLLFPQLLGGFLRPHKVPGTMAEYTGIYDWVWKPQTMPRKAFQYLHKLGGYLAMAVAAAAVITGIDQATDYDYITSLEGIILLVFALLPLAALVAGALMYHYFANKKPSGIIQEPDKQGMHGVEDDDL